MGDRFLGALLFDNERSLLRTSLLLETVLSRFLPSSRPLFLSRLSLLFSYFDLFGLIDFSTDLRFSRLLLRLLERLNDEYLSFSADLSRFLERLRLSTRFCFSSF